MSISSIVIMASIAGLACACARSNVNGTSDAATEARRTPSDLPAAKSTGAEAPSPIARARQLALTAPSGGTVVDRLMAQHQAAAQRSPANNDHWIALGRDWIRKARETGDPGYYLNAEGAAQAALANEPNDKLAIGLHAMVLMNDHRFEEARFAAERAAAIDPDDPNAYAPLSDALLELGRVDEAEAATQKMVDLKPSLPSYARVAHLRWLRGDKDGALSAYKLAISAGGDRRDQEPKAWALVQAALIFWQVGDLDGAEAGVAAALGLLPGYPPALALQGRLALARDNAAEAVVLLERAYQVIPLTETAWELGDARMAAGDSKGAEAAFAEVEKSGRRGDRRMLALFYATKNRSPKEAKDAVDLMEREKQTRGDIYTDEAYAWALYRDGRIADAKVAIDHATHFGTREARLLYHAGAIHLAAGDTSKGKELVKEALLLNPHFDETGAAEARAMVSPVPGTPHPVGAAIP